MVQSFLAHPDFSVSTLTMIVLSPGTDDITPDSGQTIGAITPQTIIPPSPAHTNQTVTYSSSKINL